MKQYRAGFLMMTAVLSLFSAGCHSPEGTSGKAGSTKAQESSREGVPSPPSILPGQVGGGNSFVPYADKPPLGTPVKTH